MKLFLLGLYLIVSGLGYSIETAKPVVTKKISFKQKSSKVIENNKKDSSFLEQKGCDLEDIGVEIPDSNNLFKVAISKMKKFQDNIDKTIQQVTNKNPTSIQVANIVFNVSNLINSLEMIIQSNQLEKVIDVADKLQYSDIENDISNLLCEVKKFLHIFSLSFIEESVKELPVVNEFDQKIQSEWYKNGFANLKKSINILEKFVELSSCREDIIAFFPVIEDNYKKISDIVSKIATETSDNFLDETLNFVQYIQNFCILLQHIETNACLISGKGITYAEEISSVAKNLRIYFSDLSHRLKEILDEVNSDDKINISENIRRYNFNADAFIQDIIHDIFSCKYNKMFYKQINDEIDSLITLIKGIKEIDE